MTPKPRLIRPTAEENARIVAAALSDPDARPLTDDQLRQMRPLKEIDPELAAVTRPLGRPRKLNPKAAVSLRLDPDLLTAMRRSGDGWQKRANEVLRKAFGLDATSN